MTDSPSAPPSPPRSINRSVRISTGLPSKPPCTTKSPAKATADCVEKPKRMRTAYNIFFHHHRQLLLEALPNREKKPRNSHGKIGFTNLARTIAARWRAITAEEKAHYQDLSNRDRARYVQEMKLWKEQQKLASIIPDVPEFSSSSEVDIRDLEPTPIRPTLPSSTMVMPNGTGSTFYLQPEVENGFVSLDPTPYEEIYPSGDHLFPDPIRPNLNVYHAAHSNRTSLQMLANAMGGDCVSAFVHAFR